MNGPLVFRRDMMVTEHDEGDGKKSIVIRNPVTEQFFHISIREYRLLEQFDGRTSLEQAVDKLRDKGQSYDINEAADILARASGLGLILGSYLSDSGTQLSIRGKMVEMRRLRRMASLFCLYIPLVNPDHLLNRTLFLTNFFFNRFTAFIWIGIGLCSLYLVMGNLARIESEHIALLSSSDLMMIWPAVVLTRLAHELGHAYAAKRYGLQVKALGIAILFFFPCPYVDTTEAWKLSSRRKRIIIGAAGMMAEMIIASLCVFLWFFSKPGMLNYLSFYVITISTVSTLIFNANPLMKFDGYFILSDYLRIPNLASRSFQYVKSLVMSKFFGLPLYAIPRVTPREALIFVSYGIASLCYRTILYGAIAAALYYRFDKVLGVVLAGYAIIVFIVRPVFKSIKELWMNRGLATSRHKAWMRLGLVCAVVATGLLWPWSQKTTFSCRADSKNSQAITIPLNSAVTNVFVREGASLVKGQSMFELDNTAFEFELRKAKLEREVIELQMKALVLEKGDLAKVPQKSLELARIDEAITRMEADLRASREATRAPFDCVVTRLDRRMKSGFQPGEGSVVGQLKSTSSRVAIAALPDRLLGRIVEGQEVHVWFPLGEGYTFSSKMELIRPYADFPTSDDRKTRLSSERDRSAQFQGQSSSSATEYDNQYVWSAEFPENQHAPLGMSGLMVIAFPPENIISRLYGYAVQTANRESFF